MMSGPKGIRSISTPPNRSLAVSMFEEGSRVDIFGLQGRKDLNGKTGTVVKFRPKQGRYRVKLFDAVEDEFILVRPSNLKDADEALFADPPPPEDCAICMQPVLGGVVHRVIMLCCGKTICGGCIDGVKSTNPNRPCCPFCRAPTPTSDERVLELNRRRVELGDGTACFNLGMNYMRGLRGLPVDHERALQLFRRGAELGSADAQDYLGQFYAEGRYGAELDMERANHFFELAARSGHVQARVSLARMSTKGDRVVTPDNYEETHRSMRRFMMHTLIAAKCGHDFSLETLKGGYQRGMVTKEEFAAALRSHKDAKDAIGSKTRECFPVAFPASNASANPANLN